MRFRLKLAVGVAVLGAAGVGTAAIAHDRSRLNASLHGFEEVPSISTLADGSFKASINRSGDEIRYTLVYDGPFNNHPTTGAPATVTQAHIHVAQPAVNGGISAWLCQTASNPAPAADPPTPPCPAPGTPVSGVIEPDHVVGPAAQGIQPGEFDELVRALRAGVAYANVHTTSHGGGEIRGQVDDDRGRGH